MAIDSGNAGINIDCDKAGMAIDSGKAGINIDLDKASMDIDCDKLEWISIVIRQESMSILD